jgi:hypothetical protein
MHTQSGTKANDQGHASQGALNGGVPLSEAMDQVCMCVCIIHICMYVQGLDQVCMCVCIIHICMYVQGLSGKDTG